MRIGHVAAIGVAAFLAAAVYLAPAGLAGLLLDDRQPMRLARIDGRVWDGSASLMLDGWPAGQLRWSFDGAGLLEGKLRFRWRLLDPGYDLAGHAVLGFYGPAFDVAGRVGAILIERVLAPYHIAAGGALDISSLVVRPASDGGPMEVDGGASWSGGPVSYRLAGRTYEARLPALEAEIETTAGEPVLTAHAAGEAVPLLRVRIDHEGWAHIGITQRFTELAGLPWPGDQPADAFVIEVGEKIL